MNLRDQLAGAVRHWTTATTSVPALQASSQNMRNWPCKLKYSHTSKGIGPTQPRPGRAHSPSFGGTARPPRPFLHAHVVDLSIRLHPPHSSVQQAGRHPPPPSACKQVPAAASTAGTPGRGPLGRRTDSASGHAPRNRRRRGGLGGHGRRNPAAGHRTGRLPGRVSGRRSRGRRPATAPGRGPRLDSLPCPCPAPAAGHGHRSHPPKIAAGRHTGLSGRARHARRTGPPAAPLRTCLAPDDRHVHRSLDVACTARPPHSLTAANQHTGTDT